MTDPAWTFGAETIPQTIGMQSRHVHQFGRSRDANVAIFDLRLDLDPIQISLTHQNLSHVHVPDTQRDAGSVTFLNCTCETF